MTTHPNAHVTELLARLDCATNARNGRVVARLKTCLHETQRFLDGATANPGKIVVSIDGACHYFSCRHVYGEEVMAAVGRSYQTHRLHKKEPIGRRLPVAAHDVCDVLADDFDRFETYALSAMQG